MPGLFITLEGIDGCGKSTLAKRLAEKLRADGHDVVTTMEPSESWLGQAVRRSYNEEISPYTEAFLFLADRATHTQDMIAKKEAGQIIICDRYSDSTVAYQGAYLEEIMAKDGIDAVSWLEEMSRPVIVTPDITFLLDIDPEVSLARLGGRDGLSKFEKLGYLRKVRANYLRVAGGKPHFMVLDASKPAGDILESVYSAVCDRL